MGSSAGGCFLPGDPPPITGALGGGAGSPTTLSLVNTLTASSYAASAHQDELFSQINLSPSSTVTAANGLNAIRGEVGLPSGKTLGGGSTSYLTGVYGRANIFGTVSIGSGDLAAVYGKMDCNGATLTSGHIAPVQSNIVNPPSDSSQLNGYYGESAGGNVINAHFQVFGKASCVFDITTNSHDPEAKTTGTTSTQAGYITVKVNGTTKYLPLYTSVA